MALVFMALAALFMGAVPSTPTDPEVQLEYEVNFDDFSTGEFIGQTFISVLVGSLISYVFQNLYPATRESVALRVLFEEHRQNAINDWKRRLKDEDKVVQETDEEDQDFSRPFQGRPYYLAVWFLAFCVLVLMVLVVLVYGLKFDLAANIEREDLNGFSGVGLVFGGPVFYQGYSEFNFTKFSLCQDSCRNDQKILIDEAEARGEVLGFDQAAFANCSNLCGENLRFNGACESACKAESECTGVTYRPTDQKCFAMGGPAHFNSTYTSTYLSRYRLPLGTNAVKWQVMCATEVLTEMLVVVPLEAFILFTIQYFFFRKTKYIEQGYYHDWLRAHGMNFNRPPRDNPLFFPEGGKLVLIEMVVDDKENRDKLFLDKIFNLGVPLAEDPTALFSDQTADGMNGNDEFFLDELIDAGAKLYVQLDPNAEVSTSEDSESDTTDSELGGDDDEEEFDEEWDEEWDEEFDEEEE
jgi:hypothetical protein